ncbi:hypothetical protein DPEC_G00239980 [Dallia pectoralis]|uniref:Uncharacterized protein n=1 Tax=Dallia pectoralis TaxID=75939 RepID=A0ACC2FZL3_DALPE|nr:hypothetical protein DPEC_G00239980 [Dallia pectoralis]
MVRSHTGPPRFKPRSFSDGYNMSHEQQYSPQPRSQRGTRAPPGRSTPNWRDSRGRGQTEFAKRPPLMGERRERPFNHWRSQNQDSLNAYPPQSDAHHGHTRPSPSRPNRPPSAPHRSSPHSPTQGPFGQRAAPVYGHHSGHRSLSPRHYNSQPSDRRPASSQSPHSSFRGPHTRPGTSHNVDKSWVSLPHHSPKERPFERPGRGGKRWTGSGPFPHSHNGDRGPPGPTQRKPRDYHGRGPYPERYRTEDAVLAGLSAERDPRMHHGKVGERQGSGRRSSEWPQEGSPHLRSPTWKGGQSASFYQNSSQERPSGPPQKRRFPERRMPPSLEPGLPKRPRRENPRRENPRRENPQCSNAQRGFGGRPLSLRDKSRLLKGRKMRAESVMGLKAPPLRPRDAKSMNTESERPTASRQNAQSTIALRKERCQPKAAPVKKRPMAAKTPPKPEANSTKSSRESGSHKEHGDSLRALSTHSASSIDQRLTRDLVVVSQWQASDITSSSKDGPTKDRSRTPKNRTEHCHTSDGQLTLNERFSKIHDSSPSPSPRDRRYAERNVNVPQENHRPVKVFRKPGPSQRPSFRPSSPHSKPGVPPERRPGPEPPGPLRKPLMGSIVPRPFSQRPVFRKSQSILSKYRNLPAGRQHVPANRGSNYRRW